MSPIAAVFRHGVFEPLEPVSLPEEQRGQLHFEPVKEQAVQAWLDGIQALHVTILQRAGTLPDSSLDIAADRMR